MHGAIWSVRTSLIVLVAATAGVALMSETLVHSLEDATHSLGWSELFIGVILIPVIDNAAEHLTAVTVAMKNKMDLSLGIAIGSARSSRSSSRRSWSSSACSSPRSNWRSSGSLS